MVRKYFDVPDRRQVPQGLPHGDLASESRRKSRESAAKERAERQAQWDATEARVAADHEALQQRIEEMLSPDSQEFVIRFLQTEGE